jgi:hypothetical protein
LRGEVFAAQSREALGAVESAMGAESLADPEVKKLRLLVARRWKLVAA